MIAHTILLVEDNADDEFLTLRAFAKNAIANPLAVARDGLEALDYLLAQGRYAGRIGGLPLLVLLDLKMPRLDGLETLRAIRADPRIAAVPVLILTSSRAAVDVEGAYAAGANGFVQKPVEFDEFVNVTRAIGQFWLLTNVPPSGTDR